MINLNSNYWKENASKWESKRYGKSFISRLCFKSIPKRLLCAQKILKLYSNKNTRILEIGCGSGLLIEDNSLQYKSYLGIDIASESIELARQKFQGIQGVDFKCQDIDTVAFEDFDLIIGLGLTDWLDQARMEILKDGIEKKYFILSFTFKYSLFSSLHSFLSLFFYFFKSKAKPRKYTKKYLMNTFLKQIKFSKITKYNYHLAAPAQIWTNLP